MVRNGAEVRNGTGANSEKQPVFLANQTFPTNTRCMLRFRALVDGSVPVIAPFGTASILHETYPVSDAIAEGKLGSTVSMVEAPLLVAGGEAVNTGVTVLSAA